MFGCHQQASLSFSSQLLSSTSRHIMSPTALAQICFRFCVDLFCFGHHSYICLGAHTGSLYFFDAASHALARLVPFASYGEGGMVQTPVTHVKFSPNGQLLALSLLSNHVVVLQLRLDNLKDRERLVVRVSEHKDRVTALCWDDEVHVSRRVIHCPPSHDRARVMYHFLRMHARVGGTE